MCGWRRDLHSVSVPEVWIASSNSCGKGGSGDLTGVMQIFGMATIHLLVTSFLLSFIQKKKPHHQVLFICLWAFVVAYIDRSMALHPCLICRRDSRLLRLSDCSQQFSDPQTLLPCTRYWKRSAMGLFGSGTASRLCTRIRLHVLESWNLHRLDRNSNKNLQTRYCHDPSLDPVYDLCPYSCIPGLSE